MDFDGEFETHISVALERPEDLASLQAWGQTVGMKCLHIILERGRFASQPMLTMRSQGSLTAMREAADQTISRLSANGFQVVRVKLEVDWRNDDVPQTDAEAGHFRQARYFEHHLKLLLTSEHDWIKAIRIAQRHEAHVSQNAQRMRGDGRQERFITQRCYGLGTVSAGERFDALQAELLEAKFVVLDEEREYVVYDSNVRMDEGWITAEESLK